MKAMFLFLYLGLYFVFRMALQVNLEIIKKFIPKSYYHITLKNREQHNNMTFISRNNEVYILRKKIDYEHLIIFRNEISKN